jgi:LytS/YehU family sensor histidine kinase
MVLVMAVCCGIILGLMRIHLGFLAKISDVMFSAIIGGVAGACIPFLVKKKDIEDD